MFQHSHQKKGRQSKTEPVSATVRGWVSSLMDFLICVYLVLMIAVMPLFFKDGYTHIATDKATFCRRVSIHILQVLIPALLIYAGISVWMLFRENGKGTGRVVLRERLREMRKKLTLTDFFMGFYGGALILSYLCSRYRENALWGAGSGWYTGFLPQLFLVIFYFFISKCWKPRRLFFCLLFAVSAVIFLLGYLNRFGFYPMKMNLSSPSFISTIGNINWYCGYAVTVLFAGVAFVWQGAGNPWQRGLLSGYVFLGFGTLVTQGSASGLVTLGVMLIVLFVLSAGSGERMLGFWTVTLLLSAACLFTSLFRAAAPGRMNFDDGAISLLTTGWLPAAMTAVSFSFLAWVYQSVQRETYQRKLWEILARILVTFMSCALLLLIVMITVNTVHPGSLGRLSGYAVFTFSDTWGSNRGATWKAGVMCFGEQDLLHKLTGVGPDAMSAYIYQDGSERLLTMLKNLFGATTKLTNAHNEWLTVLVNTGVLGFIGFAGAMVTAVRAFLQGQGKDGADKRNVDFLCCACGLSLLAYTINNLFSFQQTVNLTTMMIILGMGMAFLRKDAA